MTLRKRPAVLLPALLPVLLAGCGTPSSPAAGPPGGAPPAASVPARTPAAPGDPGGASSAAVTAPAQPVTGRCRTGELRVTTEAAPGGGAAGGEYRWLIFTNTSARTCTVYGFPGVSYLTGASGSQINEPAGRNGGVPERVTLAPGQGAHAVVRTGHPEAYPDTCHPVRAAGYQVYVPDEPAAVFVAAPITVCSTDGVNALTISPVVAGTAE